MKRDNRSFDDTGELNISDLDGFADAEDFEENSEGFANEEDFDDKTDRFANEDDYEDRYSGEEYAQEQYSEEQYSEEQYSEEQYSEEQYSEEQYSEGQYSEEQYLEEQYLEEQYSEEQYSEEEYFDDHVDYFFDDKFDEKQAGGELPEENAREKVLRKAGNRNPEVRRKPIVEVEEDEDESSGVIIKLMIGLAAVAVVLIVGIVGFFYFRNKNANPPKQEEHSDVINQVAGYVNENGIIFHEELGGAGAELSGISRIGEKGLLAAFNAKKSEIEEAEAAIAAENEKKEYEENDYENNVVISFETVSVVKDLKVKFINKATGKLIANVPFVVTVTTPGGKTLTWTDSDKDGIIYNTDLASGTYTLHLNDLDQEKYAGYTMPVDCKPVVKAELAYEKVNVAGEILDSSKVNESTEDTSLGGADTGTLADTVASVESGTVNTYVALTDNSAIIVPFSLASLDFGNTFIVRTVEGAASYSIAAPVNASVEVGKSTELSLTLENLTGDNITASSANTEIATASVSGSNVTITGVSAGNTVVTVAPKADFVPAEGSTAPAAANIIVIVSAGTPETSETPPAAATIAVDKSELSLLATKTGKAKATLTNITAENISVTSSADSVATAAISEDGTVTVSAVSAGSATITVASKADASVKAEIKVTVYGLSDKLMATVEGKSVQLYVQESNSYREATYADYSAATMPTFYYAVVSYTGWQTLNGSTYYYTADGKFVTGEQVINGVLYNFDSKGALVAGTGTLGIDVSKWNGNIDWNKVKAAGVSYVIIRVGYRGSTQGGLIDDSNFKKNIEGAIAAGLKVGVYFVTQAVNDAEAVYEASMVLDRIAGYKISYPVFLDVEASGGRGDKIDVATRTSVCKTFCKTIQNAGYTAGIYANKTWMSTMMDAAQLSSYKLWVAQYNTSCTYSGSYQLWQYTDKGKIDGITGYVDLNTSYLGY